MPTSWKRRRIRRRSYGWLSCVTPRTSPSPSSWRRTVNSCVAPVGLRSRCKGLARGLVNWKKSRLSPPGGARTGMMACRWNCREATLRSKAGKFASHRRSSACQSSLCCMREGPSATCSYSTSLGEPTTRRACNCCTRWCETCDISSVTDRATRGG